MTEPGAKGHECVYGVCTVDYIKSENTFLNFKFPPPFLWYTPLGSLHFFALYFFAENPPLLIFEDVFDTPKTLSQEFNTPGHFLDYAYLFLNVFVLKNKQITKQKNK